MALKAGSAPLTLTALQGSADAFVQASLATGLTGTTAFNLRTIQRQLTVAMVVNGATYQMALTRRSKTSMPNLSDPDVIWMEELQGIFTTSGALMVQRTNIFRFDEDIPIVEETIYCQLDSAGTSASNNLILRLGVDVDTITPIDRLTIVSRSIT